jgi:putative ABC transport system ATP-binding protein
MESYSAGAGRSIAYGQLMVQNMKVIEIKNLVKEYADAEITVKAINGIDLDIEEGEFAVIVGPSGSGKTTLLNLLGGLDKPTKGEVFINHTRINDLSGSQLIDFRLHNIGFVFQAYNLIPVLTAGENIEFIMELQGKSKAERRKRSAELLTAVGLIDRIDSRPSKLSGGQQQRVAVARALASKPRFILADEPTANLDSVSTENLLDIMEKLNHEEKVTFVFSTHDARVVKKAHRVITIEDGKVLSDVRQEGHSPEH